MASKKIVKKAKESKLPYVVVRADSGVYCGTLLSETPNGDGRMMMRLRDFRRIWNWQGFIGVRAVHTVEDIANFGVGPTSKVSSTAPAITMRSNNG